MKYLLLVTLFLNGCNWFDKPKTLENCMLAVKEKIDFANIVKSGNRNLITNVELGIFAICEDANHDPDLAMQKLEMIKQSH